MKANVGKTPIIDESIYKICKSNAHMTKEYPTIPTFKEVLHEQINFIDSYKQPFSDT